MDTEKIQAAVNDLLKQRKWYEWPTAKKLSVDQFRQVALYDVKAMLDRSGYYFSSGEVEEITCKIWRRLREE
jgi:hypothetical protein